MNEMTLFDMFMSHNGRQIDKWEHYFPIYEKHFAKYRRKQPRVLEIGIDHGGSLQLWKRYFGPGAEIVGVDISPAAMYTEDQIQTYCMDQKDPKIEGLGSFDIVIDDGSHNLLDQETSFERLWKRTLGVYLIEDCHDAYPLMSPLPAVIYQYPWVIVAERPLRMIRGKPSRELREDEKQARNLFGPK